MLDLQLGMPVKCCKGSNYYARQRANRDFFFQQPSTKSFQSTLILAACGVLQMYVEVTVKSR